MDPPKIYTCIKWNADSLLYVYEWKLCSSVVTSINTDLVDKAHSVTLRTDTMLCIHKIYTALHTDTKGEMHVLKKDGLEKVV